MRGICFLLLVFCSQGFTPAQQNGGGRAGLQEEDEKKLDALIQDVGDSRDDVVVVASRRRSSIFRSPSAVSRLDGADLAVTGAVSSLPDALNSVPGVHLQRTGPSLTSPFLRGLTGFRTVLMVDGVRLNNSVFRDGPNQYWNTVDPHSIGHLEAVMGLSSVLYGSDAIGGTVGVFTERLDLGSEGSGWTLGGRTYGRFSTAEDSLVARTSFNAGYNGRFGVSIGTTVSSFGDLDAGGDLGRQAGTSYSSHAVDAKLRMIVNDDVEMELLFQRMVLNNVPRTHSTVDGVSFHGTTIGSDLRRQFDQERDLALLTAYHYGGRFYDEAEFKLAFQSQNELEDRIRSSGRRDRKGFDLDTLALLGQFTSRTPVGDFVWGFDTYIDFVSSFANRFDPGTGVLTVFPQGSVADDALYATIGLYAEDTIELGDRFTLVTGLRYTHVGVDAGTVVDPVTGLVDDYRDSFDNLSGSVKLLAEVTDEVNLYTSLGLGFRAPNLSDLTRFDSARSNEIETPAPGLQPEHFVGCEIGAKFLTEDIFSRVSWFYTEFLDTIIRVPTGNVIDGEFEVTKKNEGDGHIQGIEALLDWNFSRDFLVSGSFAWTEGEVDTFPTSAPVISRHPLSRVPPVHGRVALRWQPEKTGFWMEASTEIVARQDRLSPRDIADTQRIPTNGTPGYTLYHLHMGYELDEKSSFFLHVNNLTDKNHRIHGSGLQEPGLNLVLGFDLRF